MALNLYREIDKHYFVFKSIMRIIIKKKNTNKKNLASIAVTS